MFIRLTYVFRAVLLLLETGTTVIAGMWSLTGMS